MDEEQFKEKLDKAFDEYRESWKPSKDPKVALARLQLSNLLFGNDSVFELLDYLKARQDAPGDKE